MENWRPVVGFEDFYEVSDLGRIRSLDRRVPRLSRSGSISCLHIRERVLRPGRRKSGHLTVVLAPVGSYNVHKLVLEAFVGPCPSSDMEARHLDGDPQNNRLGNLEWATRARNTQDRKWHRGRGHVLTPEQARQIKLALRNPYRGVQRDLALQFGVSKSTITAINAGRFHVDIHPEGVFG